LAADVILDLQHPTKSSKHVGQLRFKVGWWGGKVMVWAQPGTCFVL
jgi:hypothetical protein